MFHRTLDGASVVQLNQEMLFLTHSVGPTLPNIIELHFSDISCHVYNFAMLNYSYPFFSYFNYSQWKVHLSGNWGPSIIKIVCKKQNKTKKLVSYCFVWAFWSYWSFAICYTFWSCVFGGFVSCFYFILVNICENFLLFGFILFCLSVYFLKRGEKVV